MSRAMKVEVMAYRKFSEEQKRMWVKKFLTRGSKSIEVFCRELGRSAGLGGVKRTWSLNVHDREAFPVQRSDFLDLKDGSSERRNES